MDTTSTGTGTFAANRPTLTLNLAGRKNVSLEWFAKGFSDEANSPTLTGPLGTFGSTMNYDGVAISQDGVNWAEVNALRFLSSSYGTVVTRVMLDPVIQRLGWSYNSLFQLRFSQYDDQAIPNDGIGLDDVAVRANPMSAIALSLPPTITEGAMSLPVTVTLPAAAVEDTTVTLSSNAPARLSIVSPVTIPAGQTSASTAISAPQNNFADVGKGVVITASASGQTTSYNHIRVVDDEQPVLTLSLPASVTEGGGNGTGTVLIEPVQPVSTPVYFTSGNTDEATVTAFATISAGARSATFTITPVNDVRLDGTQVVTITASGLGLAESSAGLDVLDNESTQITVIPPPVLTEGGSPGVGSVRISGQRLVDTVVMLASGDTTEATVTASVTIPAGQVSVNFQVFPVDDDIQDGTQSVTLTASAAGLTDGTAVVSVRDNNPASFEFAIVPSPQTRNAPFAITITARDGTDSVLTGFHGTVDLSAISGGAPLSVTPAVSGTFTQGVWTGSVSVGGAGTGVTLTATGTDGATGTSDAFDVNAGGAAVALAFAPVSTPQLAGTLIPVQVSAVDAAGFLVNEVTGGVTVSLVTVPGGVVVASANLTLVNGSAASIFVMPGGLSAARLVAVSGGLSGQSADFSVLSLAGEPATLFEDGFETGVLGPEWTLSGTGTWRTQVTTGNGPRSGSRHLTMDSATDNSNARNEATLTLNLAGRTGVALIFWMREFGDEDHGPPASPFMGGADFDGVAISADGTAWYEVQGLRTANGISGSYTQFIVDLSSEAAARGLALGEGFKIRFNQYDNYAIATDGFAFDDISVVANYFEPQEPVVTLFADDFDSGVFKPQWRITGTNNHRTEITSAQAPRGSHHLLMDAHVSGLLSRNEATLTLDLGGMEEVRLDFWMKEIGDEDHGPPSIPFLNGADFDGVAISQDGVSWYLVKGLRTVDGIGVNYAPFSVDLSAAAAIHGLTFGPDFKIRFNHYDDFPVTSDGFAFDDISVTGRPAQQLALSLPAAVPEGGSAAAHVTLPAARAVDTVVNLVSNRPGSFTLPASVMIPAGSTVSADFPLTAAQDDFLTGDISVLVTATAEGFLRDVAETFIADDETPPGLLLTLPATLAEGGSISGTVSIDTPALFDLHVALSASPEDGLTLPAHVKIPAGGTSAGFTLAKPENHIILEPVSTTLTAMLGGGADSAVVALTDNDSSASLVITLPASVPEGAAPVSGSVGFVPPIVTAVDITVSLSSSDTSELTVPGNVTIPAGAGSAAFDATPVDDVLMDGAVPVIITATASGLAGDTHEISVDDDEVHHLAFDPVSSPQIALAAFAVTLRARAIDNQIVPSFTGTATLSAANAGGAVGMNPATTGAFEDGVWTGQVTFSTAAAAVTLTADAAGGLTGASNTFDVIAGPELVITPAAMNVTTLQGEPPVLEPFTLSNPGTGSLTWSAAIIGSAPWLALSSSSGVIPEGGNAPVTATLTPGLLGAGVYAAAVRFTSNDPAAPQQDIPVNFTLTQPVHHFDWSVIPSPQVANVPFAATITAKDSAGNTLTGFHGGAKLDFPGTASETVSGTGTGQFAFPFFGGGYTEYRTQCIYLPAEVGLAGRIESIAFYVTSAMGAYDNLTIRFKHTTKLSYSGAGLAVWEAGDWTTVYQANLPATASGGWLELPLTVPFEYDGAQNLMVDVSYDNASYVNGSATRATTKTSRTLVAGTTGNSNGSPLTWTGTSPAGSASSSLTNIRFTSRPFVSATPSQVTFAAGVWAGNLAAQSSGTGSLRLRHTCHKRGCDGQFQSFRHLPHRLPQSGDPLGRHGRRHFGCHGDGQRGVCFGFNSCPRLFGHHRGRAACHSHDSSRAGERRVHTQPAGGHAAGWHAASHYQSHRSRVRPRAGHRFCRRQRKHHRHPHTARHARRGHLQHRRSGQRATRHAGGGRPHDQPGLVTGLPSHGACLRGDPRRPVQCRLHALCSEQQCH